MTRTTRNTAHGNSVLLLSGDSISVATSLWSAAFHAKLRVALLLLLIFAPAVPMAAQVAGPPAPDKMTGLEAAATMEGALVDAIARCEPSIVSISRIRRSPFREELGPFPDFGMRAPEPDVAPNEYATGVIIDPSGLILTCYHALGDVRECTYRVTTIERKEYEARLYSNVQVVAADPWTDLAVLKIDAKDLRPITFGDGGTLRKGQIVISLGNPYGIARDGQASASWGIVANLSRKAAPETDDTGLPGKRSLHHYGTLIHTDAKLNLGTSGGALINLKGEMIGLTTSLAAAAGFEKSAGFAIPVDDSFKRTVETLKAGREVEVGFLGVAPRPLDPVSEEQGKRGVVINDVVPGTPASLAELRPNDIITRIDDEPILEVDDLFRALGRRSAETKTRVTIERRSRPQVVEVVLGKKQPLGNLPAVVTNSPQPWRGIQVEYATAMPDFQARAMRREVDPDGCVAISQVDRQSQAWTEGLRPGMLVSHANETRIKTPVEFRDAVKNAIGPVRLRLTAPVGERLELTIQP